MHTYKDECKAKENDGALQTRSRLHPLPSSILVATAGQPEPRMWVTYLSLACIVRLVFDTSQDVLVSPVRYRQIPPQLTVDSWYVQVSAASGKGEGI